jgi:hypothetical protein
MAKAAIDIAESLAGLSASTIFELRSEWRRLHRAPPPMRLSRDLLLRAITYKLQERPLGGLSKSTMRKLERLNLDSEASDAQKPVPPISLRAGTRLVREWRGITYTVLTTRRDRIKAAGASERSCLMTRSTGSWYSCRRTRRLRQDPRLDTLRVLAMSAPTAPQGSPLGARRLGVMPRASAR